MSAPRPYTTDPFRTYFRTYVLSSADYTKSAISIHILDNIVILSSMW